MKKILTIMIVAFAVPLFAMPGGHDEEDGSLPFWKKTKVSGTFDLNYNYNLNRPTTTAAQVAAGTAATNGYRVFDANTNTFNISLVEIALETSPTDWATFRTDLDFGRDAQAYHAFGLSGAAAAAASGLTIESTSSCGVIADSATREIPAKSTRTTTIIRIYVRGIRFSGWRVSWASWDTVSTPVKQSAAIAMP